MRITSLHNDSFFINNIFREEQKRWLIWSCAPFRTELRMARDEFENEVANLIAIQIEELKFIKIQGNLFK